jgi:hypothetical protein
MITIGILIVFALLGYSKGLVEELTSLIAVFISGVGAYLSRIPIATAIYNKLNLGSKIVDVIRPTINEQVYQIKTMAQGTDITKIDSSLLDKQLEPIKASIGKVTLMTKDISESVFSKLNVKEMIIQNINSDQVVDTVTNQIAGQLEKVLMFTLGLFAMIVVFLILMVIFGTLSKLLSKAVNKIFLVGTANHLLGIIPGLIKGGIFSAIIVGILFGVTIVKEFPALTHDQVIASGTFKAIKGLSKIDKQDVNKMKKQIVDDVPIKVANEKK